MPRPRWRSSAPDRPGSCWPTCSRRAASTASCSSSATATTSSTACVPGSSSTRPSSCCAASGSPSGSTAQGLAHRGIELAFEGRRHRIDFLDLTGRSITVYGQQEVVKDLIAARLAAGGEIVFEALDVAPADVTTDRPVVRYRHDGERHELRCRIVAGCDGFHGVCRDLVPGLAGRRAGVPVRMAGDPGRGRADDRRADLRQPRPRLRPVQHALADRHPPVPPGARPTSAIEDWSDDRIWDELHTRLPTERRLHDQHRPGAREGHHGDAQLRGHADAPRQPAARR